MQLLKLTVLSSILFAVIVIVLSCEKETQRANYYVKTGITMSGAQETPVNPSTAQGSLDVSYDKNIKVLVYKFSWSGLADTIVGIHIHGLAPVGFNASIVQNILTVRNEAAFPFRGGSYSGTLLVDGVRIKEDDLLNGLYYLNIHSKVYPGGEIRAQVKFQ